MKNNIIKIALPRNCSARDCAIESINNFLNELMTIMPKELFVNIEIGTNHPEIISAGTNKKQFNGNQPFTKTR